MYRCGGLDVVSTINPASPKLPWLFAVTRCNSRPSIRLAVLKLNANCRNTCVADGKPPPCCLGKTTIRLFSVSATYKALLKKVALKGALSEVAAASGDPRLERWSVKLACPTTYC